MLAGQQKPAKPVCVPRLLVSSSHDNCLIQAMWPWSYHEGQIMPSTVPGREQRGCSREICLAKDSRKTRGNIRWMAVMGKRRIWLGLTVPSGMAPVQ